MHQVAAGFAQNSPGSSEGTLQANHAVGRPVERRLLLFHCVGRMVGGDTVDGAVFHSLHQCQPIACGTDGRRHLQIGVVGVDVSVGEIEVMWRHLGGHPEAVVLRPGNPFYGLARTDVGHM